MGGKTFRTYASTLNKSVFFRQRMEDVKDCQPLPYFVDGSGELFEHIINFLRDPDYPCSIEYISELDRYDVDGRVNYKEHRKTFNQQLKIISRRVDYCYCALKAIRGCCGNTDCTEPLWHIDDLFPYCANCAILVHAGQELKEWIYCQSQYVDNKRYR